MKTEQLKAYIRNKVFELKLEIKQEEIDAGYSGRWPENTQRWSRVSTYNEILDLLNEG